MTFCNLNSLANEFHDVPDIPSMESYVNEIRKWSHCRRCSQQFNKNMEQLMGDLFSTMGYFTYVGAHNTQRIGHSQESFIAYCQFWETSGLSSRLAPCERIAHFDHYQDPILYNCYTLKIPQTISTSTSITGFMAQMTVHGFYIPTPISGTWMGLYVFCMKEGTHQFWPRRVYIYKPVYFPI